MSQEMIEQARLFLSFAATGLMLGAIFDVFRVIRRTAKNRAVTNICDACFWLFGGAYFISCFYRVAGANLRIYIYLAVVSGAALYFLLLSRFFVAAGCVILKIIIKILAAIAKILAVPVRFFLKKTGKAAVVVFSPVRNLTKKLKLLRRKFNFQRKLAKKI